MEYICRKKCFHRGRLFKEDEPVFFHEHERVPEHFVPLREEQEKNKHHKKGR
jgi:hypothetical protein